MEEKPRVVAPLAARSPQSAEDSSRMKSWRTLFRSVSYDLSWSKRMGLLCAATFVSHRILHDLGLDRRRLLCLRPRGCRYPLALRVAGSSDVDVLRQVFAEQGYSVLRDIPDP